MRLKMMLEIRLSWFVKVNKILICIFILGMVLISCEKNNDGKIDYREEYLGTYSFIEYKYQRSVIFDSISENRDTIIFDGLIESSGSDRLKVIFEEDYSEPDLSCAIFPIKIDGLLYPILKDSGLLDYPEINECDVHYTFEGKFVNVDSIHMLINAGAMHAGYEEIIITGSRKISN